MNQHDDFDEALNAAESDWKIKKQALTDQRWEENVLKRVLSAGGHNQLIRELKREVGEATDEPRLYFDTFIEAFPNFPLWLHCHKIPYVFETDARQFYSTKLWRRTKIHKDWLEALDRVPDYWGQRPVGLVFEWLHASGQHKIYHNCGVNLQRDFPHSRLELTLPVEDGHTHFWLDNLDDFLKIIGWSNPELLEG